VEFVAVVLALLGWLMIIGFVAMYLKLCALADELRAARKADGLHLGTQLDAIADKQQGMRIDLNRMKGAIHGQQQKIEALTFQLEGPQSMRRPVLPEASSDG